MTAPLEETAVSYKELADLEDEFSEIEKGIIRQRYLHSKPLYSKRAELVAKIPSFWPLVFKQAPMDIDEYIQPSDSALLLCSLRSLSVTRFELDEDEQKGDPRSVAIRFEFAENEHFEDTVLEKKFWWRQSKDGYAGLVSEPVEIAWKKGKDLTNGLLSLVKAVYNEQQTKGVRNVELTQSQTVLRKKIEGTDISDDSITWTLAWFGYVGKQVSTEESKTAIEEEEEERRRRAAEEEAAGNRDEDDSTTEDFAYAHDDLEIFPGGDEVAMVIVNHLWPDAIKYYFTSISGGSLSDFNLDSGEDEDE
ncbi:hypothetical protein VTK56DRAFT_3486 [Thermocarpiscus australiensis]